MYQVTAAIMHFGEAKFKQRGREEQAEADGTEVRIALRGIMYLNSIIIYFELHMCMNSMYIFLITYIYLSLSLQYI